MVGYCKRIFKKSAVRIFQNLRKVGEGNTTFFFLGLMIMDRTRTSPVGASWQEKNGVEISVLYPWYVCSSGYLLTIVLAKGRVCD